MKRSRIGAQILSAGLTIFCFLTLSADILRAQCGNYFKTDYRKVGVIDHTYRLFDWNNDGFPDHYTSESNGTNWTVKIYFHDGNGDWDFDNPTVYTSAGDVSNGTLADLDSDGDIDLFSRAEQTITTFRNNGDNTITQWGITFDTFESFVKGFPLTDINNDDLPDIVNISGMPGQGHSIGYRLAQADGTYTARVNLQAQVNLGHRPAGIGDFTGDGIPDIFYTTYDKDGDYFTKFFKNTGTPEFEMVNEVPQKAVLLVRDFNDDGRDDLLVSETEDSARILFVELSNGDGTFASTELPTLFNPTVQRETRIVEMSGDDNPDFIEIGNGFYSVHVNNGSGGFTRTDYPRPLPANYFFDHDGDGRDDLLLSVNHTIYNNFNQEILAVKKNVCDPFGETKRANFDGNLTGEMVFWKAETGDWRSRDANWGADDTSSGTFNWGLGSLSDIPAPGDFDGDGRTDYTVYRNDTGQWYIFRSSDASWYVFKFGLPGDITVPADYDGGGRTDIAVYRPSGGDWYIFSSETQQFSAIHWGTTGDKPVPEDYDGDGSTDLAVYRPSEGNWYYLRSSDLSYGIYHWGIETDQPIPADYDGDGRADLAVFREGDWYILRSMDDSFNFIDWGTTGDYPFAVYTNDIVPEIAVFRPGFNIWYNYRRPHPSIEVYGNGLGRPIYFGLPNN